MRNSVVIAVLITDGLTITSAHGQSLPLRPVTLVVPFAVGGPVDVAARVLSDPMRHSLGQPVIVENVTRAAGAIGHA